MTTGGWVAFECKGRVSAPDRATKQKAKEQALRLISVGASLQVLHIGAVTYFQKDALQFYWQDPDSGPVKRPIELNTPSDEWRHYYAPIFDLIRSHRDDYERMLHEAFLVPVEGADIEVGVHPAVLRSLDASQWSEARSIASGEEVRGFPHGNVRYQADGIAVVAGSSWLRPFPEPL